MKKTTIAVSLLILVMVSSIIIVNFNEIVEFASITGWQVMSTRLVIVTAESSNCNITFYNGWNLVSFPCINSPISITNFFTNYSELESVRYYDAADPNDPWKSYNPNLPSWVVHDLSSFSRTKGYLVDVNNDSGFYIENDLGRPTIVPLSTGWNMIGYPAKDIRQINDTFDTLIPDYDYVLLYNASESDWKEYTWNTSLPSDQDLNETHPEYGYWVFALDDIDLRVT